MKSACLLSLGGGFISLQYRANPFRRRELGRLPFLMPVKPVSLAPVSPSLAGDVTTSQRSHPAGRPGRIETIVLKLLGVVFAMTLVGCGFGAQRIAYARDKADLARQLRQKEHELRAVTQAYWSLESQKALEVAQGYPPTVAPLAGVGTVHKGLAGIRSQLRSGRGTQLAPIASVKPPTRRTGIHG